MITAADTLGGENAPRTRSRRMRFRNRDLFAPVLVIGVLSLSHAIAHAEHALPVTAASFVLVLAGLVSVLLGGPRHVTTGAVAAGAALIGYAAVQASGPFDRAFGDLAALVAAGAVWVVGYIVARQGRTLDLAWTVLVWASLAYCVIVFFGEIAQGLPQFSDHASGASPTPSITYGLLALLGCCRVLHMMKRLDAEAAPESEVVGRIIQQGLGGVLLAVFALACLFTTASAASILITLGVIIGYCTWDLHNVIKRSYGSAIRILGWIAPQIALILIGLGLVTIYFEPTGVSTNLAGADAVVRLDAYYQALLENPLFGHGLGALEPLRDRITTLHNANALLVEGGARNVAMTWLVETGVVGFGLMCVILLAMHVQIARGLGGKRTPRTFLRLAVAASTLLLIQGLSQSSLDQANIVWFYALLLGLACGVATVSRERGGKAPTMG